MSKPNLASHLSAKFLTIDWQAPWLTHIRQLRYLSLCIQTLCEATSNLNNDSSSGFDDINDPSTTMIADVLNNALTLQSDSLGTQLPTTKPMPNSSARRLNFVSQEALPADMSYETFIGITGHIPTRNNLHDLFNGSIWLTFPKTKALLNYYHRVEMAKAANKQNTDAVRGRVRDTITVFDENGAVLVTSDSSIGQALIEFNWQDSLVTTRGSWDNPYQPKSHAQAAVYIFGHALLEQLIYPRKPLCAHSVIIHVSQDFFALSTSKRMELLDDKLVDHMDNLLSSEVVTPRQLSPLPILGVPYFWAKNSDPSFYDDSFVFRSTRRSKG